MCRRSGPRGVGGVELAVLRTDAEEQWAGECGEVVLYRRRPSVLPVVCGLQCSAGVGELEAYLGPEPTRYAVVPRVYRRG